MSDLGIVSIFWYYSWEVLLSREREKNEPAKSTCFLKVAELEHITRASEALNLSQPAVTKTIQSLEHELGLELVEAPGAAYCPDSRRTRFTGVRSTDVSLRARDGGGSISTS